jgi:DNA-binding SARP family transcriptional activator
MRFRTRGPVQHEKNGQWEQAAAKYERALQFHHLREDLFRQLMICYEQLGRRTDAITVYRRCEKMLTEALHIKPSASTRQVFTRPKALR